MKIKVSILLMALLLVSPTLLAIPIEVYPSNWWTGMKRSSVQLLIRNASGFKDAGVRCDYPGVTVSRVHTFKNNHYLAVDIVIGSTAKPGVVIFKIGTGKTAVDVNWELKQRRPANERFFAQGVTSEDVIYLIMPDRFSNGDDKNDKVAAMKDQTLNRDSLYHRHGGDLQGVINKLGYLKDLGVTAIWLTPVLENNMPDRTEHGYSITDHYKVDPRLGGTEKYRELIETARSNGIKIVHDAVYNHIGSGHILIQDPPSENWINTWDTFTKTTYKEQTLFDPYASAIDRLKMSNAWFDYDKPDLNQSNPFVESYLIQNALWLVEYFGFSGYRIDTYAYNDLDFMNRCNEAVLNEYPSITLFGETYVHGVINQSYFCENKGQYSFKSNLPNTTDFQTLFYGIQAALTEPFGWTSGVNKMYYTASQDILYKNPSSQVIFLDNHDISRFFSIINKDIARYQIAIKWLFTFRGIPQLYYGDEIGMSGFADPDGWVRQDFQGGWKEDKRDKFSAPGRTADENTIWNLTQTMARYRANSTALRSGNFMQYVPENGLYVYFRYTPESTVMCVMNTLSVTQRVDFNRFEERTKGFREGTEVTTGQSIPLNTPRDIQPFTMWVVELKK